EKLINKLIEEAKLKAEEIKKRGEEEYRKKLEIEKEKIRIDFEKNLEKEKKKIDKEVEKEIINFKLIEEKEILSLKNLIIEKVQKKVEEKFNEFLNENMEEIVNQIIENLNEKDILIIIPEGQSIKSDFPVVNDKNIKNSFKIKSKNWEIEFSWENLKNIFENRIKEKANKFLFYE
ncbi:MAG: V-type ATP synthase subunit E family protein, partial [Candidatus Omnitrophica bacterium]|nr:V-type ATP synthase subunit E family protein [Candidatus Omnitrophota bacterium]